MHAHPHGARPRSLVLGFPLSATRTSIGMVTDTATYKQWRMTPEEALESSLREVPHLRRSWPARSE